MNSTRHDWTITELDVKHQHKQINRTEENYIAQDKPLSLFLQN